MLSFGQERSSSVSSGWKRDTTDAKTKGAEIRSEMKSVSEATSHLFASLSHKRVSEPLTTKTNKLEGTHQFKMAKRVVGFEVFTAVVMNSIIFWDMTPCSPLSFNRRFGRKYRFHLQGRRNKFNGLHGVIS
jgi:hypothetical protein